MVTHPADRSQQVSANQVTPEKEEAVKSSHVSHHGDEFRRSIELTGIYFIFTSTAVGDSVQQVLLRSEAQIIL